MYRDNKHTFEANESTQFGTDGNMDVYDQTATFERGNRVGTQISDSTSATPQVQTQPRSNGFFGGFGRNRNPAKNHPDEKVNGFESKSEHSYRMGGTGGDGNVAKGSHEHIEQIEITKTRRLWVACTWGLTFCIPSPFIKICGRMRRPDVQMAWREKVAICVIIFLLWFIVLFLIIGLGLILCPRQYVWTMDDVNGLNTPKKAYVALRGDVYDITDFMKQRHGTKAFEANQLILEQYYAGQDINATFPIPVRVACPQFVSQKDDPNNLFYYPVPGTGDVDPNTAFMFQHTMNTDPTSKELKDPMFFSKYAIPGMKPFKKGGVVWKFKWIESMYKDQAKYWRVINKEVFNMQPYFDAIDSQQNENNKYNLFDKRLEGIMDQKGYGGADITEDWEKIKWTPKERDSNYACMKNLFYVGKVDERQSVRCLFTNYMLLAFACLLMLVVLVKFLTALQFGNKKRPVPPQKFVICQVPCYTEDDESLTKTINSLCSLDYDDKHKLIFIICDGNIVGSGNDRPTPRIVLDVLGVDPEYDPPGRDYLAIAEGSRRHNVAKIYSGLYEYEGHVVPFMVVAKIGTPEEANRSGNRGKRDSQILLMSFFNKVHFDLPMTPLELEVYHQIRHIIGVPPSDYEFLLQIDADTEVMPDSLTRLVSACSSDQRIAGICGETVLGNESKSWTTMMQVYEYFISHHMSKAFESLFGSVTCLPGCFCMYRLRSSAGKPLLISNQVLEAYSELHVDTLHKKNLLSLGEDRYLTTLMMKHFPQFKLKFIQDAKCKTIAPEKWSILMSQRRRWINSTIHNLSELMFLSELCGFCCFSMRFVVFLDLFGTITMPTTLIYFGYLIYAAATDLADVGYISLIIIGATFGLQAIIFILRREWQHIGWMIIYLCAYPLWSFVLPIYSFWHMDDFSWGNTRVVVGDGKRKIIISDDKEFDPESIPQRRWIEYETELTAAGVLNAPPPNMNPNAGSNKEEERVSMYSRQSGNISGPYHASLHSGSLHRAATPATSFGAGMNFSDPRLSMAAPTVPHHSSYLAQSIRAASPARGYMPVTMDPGFGSQPPSANPYVNPLSVAHASPVVQPVPISPAVLPSHLQQSGEYFQVPHTPQANTGQYPNPQLPSGVAYGGQFIQGEQPLTTHVLQNAGVAPHYYEGYNSGIGSTEQGGNNGYTQQGTMAPELMGGGTPGMMMKGLLPSDNQLIESIKRILNTQNLSTVTKKKIRLQLSEEYGVDLISRKEFIGDAIELILSGQL